MSQHVFKKGRRSKARKTAYEKEKEQAKAAAKIRRAGKV
jgi:hypothetical protein